MVKNKIDLKTMKGIQRYLGKVREHYNIESAYLFGSYAKGQTHKDSDIDIAIISSDIKNRCLDGGKMMALTWGINTLIEPHAISMDDYNDNSSWLVREIKTTGIKVA